MKSIHKNKWKAEGRKKKNGKKKKDRILKKMTENTQTKNERNTKKKEI